MKKDFISRGRSVSDLKAHLVLTTKYRLSVFNLAMIKRLHEIFEELLDKWECKIVEFNGEENHVHLLFQYHPEIQLSKLVNSLKSVSSRKLRQEFLPFDGDNRLEQPKAAATPPANYNPQFPIYVTLEKYKSSLKYLPIIN